MAIKYLRTANINNKIVLLRASLDAPVSDKTGLVSDNFRLLSALPSIHTLQDNGNTVIICGKRGRPEGDFTKTLSLEPVAKELAKLLNLQLLITNKEIKSGHDKVLVFFTGDIRETANRKFLMELPLGSLVLLENLEFYSEELANSMAFGKQLATLADAYVDDDFSKCHHASSSTVSVAKNISAFAGLQLEKEILDLNRVLERPKLPFVLLMGGIKISDKAKTLQNLGKKADMILLAGGLANLFFLSRGYEIGKSKAENNSVKLAFQMDKNFKGKLFLPVDVVVANIKMERNSIRTCPPHEVKKNELILDVGPKTILLYAGMVKKAKTVVWNGPLGHFEINPFHHGTISLARIVGAVSKGKCFGVVGGGETVDAVRQAGQDEYIDHLSTGGGAMLEFLAGSKLPGVEVLK